MLVFSIALGDYERLFRRCIESHEAYCRRHHYDYLLVNRAPRTLLSQESSWLKIPLLLAALEKGYEWIAFLDADCEVSPHAPPFSALSGTNPEEQSVFLAPGKSNRINAGVIFVKNRPATLSLLRTMLDHADQKVPSPEDRAPYENGHLIHFARNNPAVHLLEHRLWNNNSVLDEKSHIQHYSSGVLRELYLDAAGEKRPKRRRFRNLLRRIRARIPFLAAAEKSGNLSENLRALAPYYKQTYAEFSSIG
jgi:hypothetical protein